MDYGFAPGSSAHHVNLRSTLTRRPSTTLVNRRDVVTIHDFIDRLEIDPAVTPPIGDMVIGTHAASKGFMTIRLSRGQAGFSDFEGVHDSIGAGSDSVAIPDALIGFASGGAVTHNFHIKGCNVGRDRTDTSRTPAAPFLVKIKEALGDHVNVTAPKHFHGLDPASGVGMFEYMAYEFKLGVTPTVGARGKLRGFADRDAALAAFRAGGFTYLGNVAVGNADWIPLIPNDITKTKNESIKVPLGTTIGTRQTMNVRRQFRFETDDVDWTLTFPNAADIPSDKPGRLAQLRADIPRDDRFKPTHPFPQYERLGFTSFTDFFAGYHWSFGTSKRDLVCKGVRFIYTVLLPIVDRTTGNVIFNFYPDVGSTIPAVTTGLRESDNQFFGRA